MATTKSYVKYNVTEATAALSIPFPFAGASHISVTTPATWSGTWVVNTALLQVQFVPAVTTGEVLIRRNTPAELLHIFVNLARFNFRAVDDSFTRCLYWFQEARDSAELTDAAAVAEDLAAVRAEVANLGSSVSTLEAVSDRTLKISAGSSSSTAVPAPVARRVLGWDSAASALANIELSAANTSAADSTGRWTTVQGFLSYLLSSAGTAMLNLTWGTTTRTVDQELRETVRPAQFGAYNDGVHDDAPAVRAALAYAVAHNRALDLGAYTYFMNSTESPLPWESMSPILRLPNAPVSITGSGYVLQSGTGVAGLAMLQTTYGSTARILISGGSIRGTGNEGSYVYALVDGVVLNGGTQNVCIDLRSIESTKRHGVYIVDGAAHNTVKVARIQDTNREMSGCGVQIEGSSYNSVHIDQMRSIGSNGIDINAFTAGGYYPNTGGAPYSATNNSTGNVVNIRLMQSVGVNNNSGGSWNGDDDYYGINVIGATTADNIVRVGQILDVRTSNGTIAPAASTAATAIRLMNCLRTVVEVDAIRNIGPSSSGSVIKTDACLDCTVDVRQAVGYATALYPAVPANTAGNRVLVRSARGFLAPGSADGLSFKYIQQPTCTTTLTGVVSGWRGDWGLTFNTIPGGLSIAVDASTYKALSKDIRFSYPYIMLDFEYNMSATPGAVPQVGLLEAPYSAVYLVADAAWHRTSVLIPYTDGVQSVGVSPNNSGTPASGATLQVRGLTFTLPDGTVLGDSQVYGLLNGAPTVGAHTAGEYVQAAAPAVGAPKGWLYSTAGTWTSTGNL